MDYRRILSTLALAAFTLPQGLFAQAGSGSAGSQPGGSQSEPSLAVSSPSPDSPKIRFTKTLHHFGTVEEGENPTHLFKFKNEGKGTLKIQNVQASCGCTAAATEGSSEIAPGDVGFIRASYDTNNRPGPASKTIQVTTNDPTQPSLTLTFDVTVEREVDVQPPQLYFFGLRKGKESNVLQAKVLGKDKLLGFSKFKVLSAESTTGRTRVSTETIEESGRPGVRLDVSVPDTATVGPVQDEILVRTNSKKKPEIRIPVQGEVVGRIQTQPKNVYFGGTANQPVTVRLQAEQPFGFKVEKVTSEKGAVRAQVSQNLSAGGIPEYSVVVTPKRSLPAGSFADTVVVVTNDEEEKEIRIPVTGVVNP